MADFDKAQQMIDNEFLMDSSSESDNE